MFNESQRYSPSLISISKIQILIPERVSVTLLDAAIASLDSVISGMLRLSAGLKYPPFRHTLPFTRQPKVLAPVVVSGGSSVPGAKGLFFSQPVRQRASS